MSSTQLSLDESMISFSGNHSGKVYMPRKPITNGFKMYAPADFKGHMLSFLPLFAKPKSSIRDIVFELIPKYIINKGYNFYMDR